MFLISLLLFFPLEKYPIEIFCFGTHFNKITLRCLWLVESCVSLTQLICHDGKVSRSLKHLIVFLSLNENTEKVFFFTFFNGGHLCWSERLWVGRHLFVFNPLGMRLVMLACPIIPWKGRDTGFNQLARTFSKVFTNSFQPIIANLFERFSKLAILTSVLFVFFSSSSTPVNLIGHWGSCQTQVRYVWVCRVCFDCKNSEFCGMSFMCRLFCFTGRNWGQEGHRKTRWNKGHETGVGSRWTRPSRQGRTNHTWLVIDNQNPKKLPLYSAVKRSCAGRVKVTVSIDYQFFALEFGWSLVGPNVVLEKLLVRHSLCLRTLEGNGSRKWSLFVCVLYCVCVVRAGWGVGGEVQRRGIGKLGEACSVGLSFSNTRKKCSDFWTRILLADSRTFWFLFLQKGMQPISEFCKWRWSRFLFLPRLNKVARSF